MYILCLFAWILKPDFALTSDLLHIAAGKFSPADKKIICTDR